MFNILERIDELRKARKYTIYKLSKLSGISQSTFSTWYKKNLYPPIDKLEMICDALGISLSEFFNDGEVIVVDSDQMELINKWILLSPKQKFVIHQIMDTFIDE